jgi:membrane protein DedA with SNARE-associated domain
MIGALAAAENIFPPVPADTAVALGAFLSAGGRISATAVFLITWVANVTTATSVYLAGRTVGRSFFQGRLGRRLMHPRRLARLEDLYRHYGSWGIFVSRFIPGVRGVVPPFAGVAHLPFWRSVPPMALASGIWYGALTFTAASLVTRLDDVVSFVSHFNIVALLAAVALIAVAGFAWWRRRARLRSSSLARARSGDAEGQGG